MDLFDVMYNCRAMRRLDTREVPEELLVKLIDAANQAYWTPAANDNGRFSPPCLAQNRFGVVHGVEIANPFQAGARVRGWCRSGPGRDEQAIVGELFTIG